MNFQPPPFEPLRFFPSAEKEDILKHNVLHLYVVAHETLAAGGNHWCLYLSLGAEHSVSIDITPSYDVPSVNIPNGSKAYMPVSLLPYTYLRTATKVVGIQVRESTKVKDFVDLLVRENRHRYEFDANGQGCRYWTDDQIILFQERGLVLNPSQVQEAREAILTKHPSQVKYPLVVGSYY